MKKNTKILLIGGLILAAVVVIIVLVVRRRSSNDDAATLAAAIAAQQNPAAPCVPYTQQMMDRDTQKLRSKCLPKTLIPIVGAGAYAKCMQEGKANLPLLKRC